MWGVGLMSRVCVVVCEQETVGRVCNKVLSDNGVSKDERHRRAQGTHYAHTASHRRVD